MGNLVLISSFTILPYSEVAIKQVHQASSISTDSMSNYQALQSYVSGTVQSLSVVQEESSDQRLNLANFLEQVRDKTWVDIKLVLSTLVAVCIFFLCVNIYNFPAARWSQLPKMWDGQARLIIFHVQRRIEKPLNLPFSIF